MAAIVTLIAALISAGVTLGVCLINNHFQQQKLTALLEYRLTELEKKVDKHNNLVERTYSLESRMNVAEEKAKVANHRIDDLEDIERKG